MVFKKLHLGSVSFSKEALDEVETHLLTAYTDRVKSHEGSKKGKIRRTVTTRVKDAVQVTL